MAQSGGIIQPDEHVFIAGMTGSGKTYLAQCYAAGIDKRVLVLDSKGTFEWPHMPQEKRVLVTRLAEIPEAVSRFNYLIYRPAREELNIKFYDAFFQFCYELGNCTVLVDEVMQVCPNSSAASMPEFYRGILTRGRELNVNVWSCTQRPATIPVVIYSESTHMFIFKLNAAPDRERMADFFGYEDFEKIIPKYQFWYYNANTGNRPELGILTKGVK